MNAMAQAEMLADITITFPALWKRPVSELGDNYADAEGIWTGQDGRHVMPDGDPIFFDLANGEPPYNGTVHGAFEAWLQARGWLCERYDSLTYVLLPADEVAVE